MFLDVAGSCKHLNVAATLALASILRWQERTRREGAFDKSQLLETLHVLLCIQRSVAINFFFENAKNEYNTHNNLTCSVAFEP